MSTKKIPRYLLSKIRQICLALPETREVDAVDQPSFCVNGKVFAGIGHGEQQIGNELREVTSTAVKANGRQAALLKEGEPYFKPKSTRGKGWIGIVLTKQSDWDMVRELVIESWKTTAPKELVSEFSE